MKKNSLKLVAICLSLTIIISSCATKKKYGCPNHISIEKLLGF